MQAADLLAWTINKHHRTPGVPSENVFLTVRDRAMLETLYSAALRVSELCGRLNWSDLDWNKREITVTGKGNKTRVCPLGQT
jgi:integrase/recombinase XerC